MNDESKMPFGAHKGRKLKDVPADYMLWCWDKFIHQKRGTPLYEYIVDAWKALTEEASDYIPQNIPEKHGGKA